MNEEELYLNANLSLLRPEFIQDICMHLSLLPEHIEYASRSLVGWGPKELAFNKNNGNPIKIMFNILQNRNFCNGYCIDPEVHMEEEKCSPIGLVRDRLRDICLAASNIFDKPEVREQVLLEIQTAVSAGDLPKVIEKFGLPIFNIKKREAHFFKSWKFLRKKKVHKETTNVLLVDCCNSEPRESYQTAYLYNLLQNLNENFKLYIAFELESREFDRWKQYMEFQLKHNADCFVVVVTPLFLEHFNWHNTMSEASSITDERRRISHLLTSMRAFGKTIFAVVIDKNLVKEASKVSPFVFDATDERQLQILLHMISRVNQPVIYK